eukprot:1731852-Prymnesium_polylepis.2
MRRTHATARGANSTHRYETRAASCVAARRRPRALLAAAPARCRRLVRALFQPQLPQFAAARVPARANRDCRCAVRGRSPARSPRCLASPSIAFSLCAREVALTTALTPPSHCMSLSPFAPPLPTPPPPAPLLPAPLLPAAPPPAAPLPDLREASCGARDARRVRRRGEQ